MQQITTEKQLKALLDKGLIGKGTYSTGKIALSQGKPTFIYMGEPKKRKSQ